MMRGQVPNSFLSDEIADNKIYQVGNKRPYRITWQAGMKQKQGSAASLF
jgi:hypothetical protein